jgi:hypothetical protein
VLLLAFTATALLSGFTVMDGIIPQTIIFGTLVFFGLLVLRKVDFVSLLIFCFIHLEISHYVIVGQYPSIGDYQSALAGSYLVGAALAWGVAFGCITLLVRLRKN